MSKDYSIVQRGQVFWFDPSKTYGNAEVFTTNSGKEHKSSIQNRNRPWVVVSNNRGNHSSPTCNIIPITTESKTPLPVHVNFMYDNKKQTVLVEQMRTVDILALNDYICTLSDDVMLQIEKAIAIQYNIRPQVTYNTELNNTIGYLEKVISNIINTKVNEIKKSIQEEQNGFGTVPVFQIEETAVHLGQMMEKLIDTEVKPEMTKGLEKTKEKATETTNKKTTKNFNKSTSKYAGMSAVEKFNTKYGIQSSDNNPATKRNTWTVESRQEYLQDCQTMTVSEIMKKYGFSKPKSVAQTKYLHKLYLSNRERPKKGGTNDK